MPPRTGVRKQQKNTDMAFPHTRRYTEEFIPLQDVPPPKPCFTLLPQKLHLELSAAAELEQTPTNFTASRPSKLPLSVVEATNPRPSPTAVQAHLGTLLKQFEQLITEHSKNPSPTAAAPSLAPTATTSPSPATASPLREHIPSGPKPKLPHFSGQTSLQAFLALFELAATKHCWSLVIKASYLTQSLEGATLEILLDLEPEERADYLVLLRALKRRFGENKSYLLLQNQLQNCRSTPGECLGALVADIVHLTRRAYRSEGSSFIRRIVLDSFLRSIEPPELRYQVRLLTAFKEYLSIDRATAIEAVFLDQPAARLPASQLISRTRPLNCERVQDMERICYYDHYR
ncbi:UNVERIFIED_CONTAM: hypothetical protein FKN15_038844 [Acipenser sinensis]